MFLLILHLLNVITGIVYNQFSNGVTRCFASGRVELYEDEGLTTLINSSLINGSGVYTLGNTPNYSDRNVILVVKNSLGNIVYKNSFFFYSDSYGNQINYGNLNIIVNDPRAILCTPAHQLSNIFCSFYIIRKPCSNILCVYNTSSSTQNYSSYTFYLSDNTEVKGTTKFGENVCFDYGNCIVGNILVCQNLRLYDTVISTGCCGNVTYEHLGELLFECGSCQTISLEKRLPEVSFVIENPCCKDCTCYDVDTPITFIPSVKFNLSDCCIGAFPRPCVQPPVIEFDKYSLYQYDKPFIYPQDGTLVDNDYLPDFDRIYKVRLSFNVDVPCLCEDGGEVIISSIPNTYSGTIPINITALTIPDRVYFVLDDNTPLYFGAYQDLVVKSYEISPSVGNQDIVFDTYFLFNTRANTTQELTFTFQVEYCGTIFNVEVVQTIGIEEDDLTYSQIINIT